jgi:3'-phosphoadenosine 5'-phosphosulfate sulfotransferase (PAPS reductase)/FAD synthetase
MTLVKGKVIKGASWLLVTGARKYESVRRMGHTVEIRVGDAKSVGSNKPDPLSHRRVWVNPCFDWTVDEQREFMDSFRLDRNPVKESPLGKSGECFCGCFNSPQDLEVVRVVCPDVAEKIDRLAVIAKMAGKKHIWGNDKLPDGEIEGSGPLCSSCEVKAKVMGLTIKQKNVEG